MKMRFELNGWQRFWVVTAVIYLLCILATGYVILPSRRQIGHDMVNSVIDEVRKYDPFAFIGEPPHTTFEAAEKEGYERWEKRVRANYKVDPHAAGFERIEKAYRQAFVDLSATRLKMCVWLALGWAIPMLLLSVFGRAMRWVVQGSGETK